MRYKAVLPQSLRSLEDTKASSRQEPQLLCEVSSGQEQTIQSSVSGKVAGNIHHKVISTSQELLVPCPVASLTLWLFLFLSAFIPRPHVLGTEDLQMSLLQKRLLPRPPVTG